MTFSPETIQQLYRAMAYHQERARMLYELLAETPAPAIRKARQNRTGAKRRQEKSRAAGTSVRQFSRAIESPHQPFQSQPGKSDEAVGKVAIGVAGDIGGNVPLY